MPCRGQLKSQSAPRLSPWWRQPLCWLFTGAGGSRDFGFQAKPPPPQPVLKPRGLLGEVDNCKRIVGWEFCPQLQKRTSLRGSPRAPQKSEVGRGRAQRS